MSDTDAPPLNGRAPIASPAQGGRAGRQVQPGDCPTDNEVKSLALALAREIKAGNVSAGRVRRTLDGQVDLCFRLKDSSQYAEAWQAGPLAADWMRQNRVLGRREFFARYPLARNSASLHDRALRILARTGEIEKDHGYWVWKDGEQ